MALIDDALYQRSDASETGRPTLEHRKLGENVRKTRTTGTADADR